MLAIGVVGALARVVAHVEADVAVEAVVLKKLKKTRSMYLRIAVGAKIDGKADEFVARAVHRTLNVKSEMSSHSSVYILVCKENRHSITEQRLSLL